MKYCFGDDIEFVPADFARRLERERDDAMANLLCYLRREVKHEEEHVRSWLTEYERWERR
jgi:hypothetical protein